MPCRCPGCSCSATAGVSALQLLEGSLAVGCSCPGACGLAVGPDPRWLCACLDVVVSHPSDHTDQLLLEGGDSDRACPMRTFLHGSVMLPGWQSSNLNCTELTFSISYLLFRSQHFFLPFSLILSVSKSKPFEKVIPVFQKLSFFCCTVSQLSTPPGLGAGDVCLH